ncbi:uncharacterized protein LOC120288337 isoform X1 [Eucalyptus grandis]|uniref:uncharacterized protein LOC120288337 isoform X1 n=1 Tax=Eucalyptus grandis TaxID=71139 RepID=UPI00192F0F3C|nr:uncharacterized protein LOC120288337 isoform X1 [Eucalyptus grandis]
MAMNGNCHAKDSSIDKMRICLNEVSIEEDSGHDSIDLHGSFTSSDWSKQQKKCPQTSQNEVSGSDAIVPMELQPYVTTGAHSSAEDDKMLMQCATSPDRKVSLSHSLLGGIRNSREQELHGMGNEVKLDRILKEEDRLMDRGAAVDVESTTFDVLKHLQHEQKQGAALEVESTTLDVLKHLQREKKRRHSDLVETALQTSFGTNEKVAWNNVSSENVKIEHVDKKQKTDCREIYEASRPIDANLVDGFASQKSAQDSTLAVVEKLHNKVCDEPINLENTGTAERFFFPVLSNHAKDLTSAESSMPWKTLPSSVPARSHDGVPNLDLALGAKTKSSNKGLLPLWIGVADKSDSHPEAVAAQEEDPVSGSLSLSLSFPFPDSDKGFKPVPDAEQLLPESRRVNTSLLLFGDFSEK